MLIMESKVLKRIYTVKLKKYETNKKRILQLMDNFIRYSCFDYGSKFNI